MAITTWSSVDGSWTLPHRTARQGKRQMPFLKTSKPPLAYYVNQVLLDSNQELGPLRGQCGAGLWGFIEPRPICTSLFDSTNLSFEGVGNLLYASAYNKFKDKALSQASNLTSLVERRKTFDMMLARLVQLKKGADALREGKFRSFLRTFGVKPLKKHQNKVWSRPREFGKLWLEYWMGWAPTVGDVQKSMEVLTKEIPTATIRAGSSSPFETQNTRVSGSSKSLQTNSCTGAVWVNGLVSITNPNLSLANQLGLVNPFKTLWETLKFSWMFDWFSNIGQVLGQFTDWVGLQLTNLSISVKTTAESDWSLTGADLIYGSSYPKTMFCSRSYFWFGRYVLPSFPLIKPKISLFDRLSLSRATTLVSLLTTMFAPRAKN